MILAKATFHARSSIKTESHKTTLDGQKRGRKTLGLDLRLELRLGCVVRVIIIGFSGTYISLHKRPGQRRG